MVLHYTLGFASWLFTIETDGGGAFSDYTHSFASQNYHPRAPRGIAIIIYNHYSNGCHKMQYPCEILDIKFSMIFHLQNLLLGLACWDFIYIVLLRSKRISVNFLKIIKPIWAICQKYFFFIEQAMKLWYIFGPIAFLLPPAASNPFSSHMLYHLNSGGVFLKSANLVVTCSYTENNNFLKEIIENSFKAFLKKELQNVPKWMCKRV